MGISRSMEYIAKTLKVPNSRFYKYIYVCLKLRLKYFLKVYFMSPTRKRTQSVRGQGSNLRSLGCWYEVKNLRTWVSIPSKSLQILFREKSIRTERKFISQLFKIIINLNFWNGISKIAKIFNRMVKTYLRNFKNQPSQESNWLLKDLARIGCEIKKAKDF